MHAMEKVPGYYLAAGAFCFNVEWKWGQGASGKLRKRPVSWELEEEQVEGTWGI